MSRIVSFTVIVATLFCGILTFDLQASGRYGLYNPCGSCQSECYSPPCCDPCTDQDLCCFYDYLNPCAWEYALRGEFLYWNVQQKDLDYAVDNLGGSVVDGNVHFLGYGYRPGFRAAVISAPRHCDSWEIHYEYTNLQTKAQGSVAAPSGGTLNLPLTSPLSGVTTADFASGSNRLNYDVGDILVYGQCCCGQALTFRPFGGVRFLRMDQNLHVEYSGAAITDGPQTIELDSGFKALGLRGGTEAELTLCGGLKSYAGIGGSVLAARNKTNQREYEQATGDFVINLRQREQTALFGYDVKAGFLYDYCLCNHYEIKTAVGYEFHQWLDTPEIRRFTDDINPAVATSGNNGSICFHGLVARLQVGF